jgi:hypothetical protein
MDLLLSDYTVNTVKMLLIFPYLAGISLTKLSLVGNNLINPDQGEFTVGSDIPAGDGKIVTFFYSVGPQEWFV